MPTEIVQLSIQSIGMVCFSPKHNRFFKIYAIHDRVLIGGLTIYFGDSMTNTSRTWVTRNFLLGCQLVDCIDNFAEHDGIGWRVKTKRNYDVCNGSNN